jgi:DNA ligase-1
MKFSDVARSFELISATSSRLEITALLAALFKPMSPDEIEIVCNLSLGQLHAPYIGTQFNIAEKNMIKVVAALLEIAETDVEQQLKQLGDLGSVAATGSWTVHEHYTIEQVYAQLSAIEQLHGSGSAEEKNHQLEQLLRHVDPIAAKYIIRMVLGNLRLGFSDMTLVDALSWMITGDKKLREQIEYAYNKCADLGLIAKIIKAEGYEKLADLHVQLGIPIRPAAAERMPTAQAVMEKLGHCYAQPKLDGFRLQVHLDKRGSTPKIWFFSRNLQDMSAMFPDLTAAVAQLPVQTLICEGEAIACDPNTGYFLPFQETVKRKRKHDIDEVAQEFPLQVYLFDLLYLNGESLINVTHMMRREVLVRIIEQAPQEVVKIIPEEYIISAEQLLGYFQANISAGLEGLVVKRPDSVYTPGKRNFNWIKLKRQEEGHLEDTLDAVVLGYYYGQGKRAAFGIGAFLVGLYNSELDRFETVAKVGTGLKDEDWIELKQRCDKIVVHTLAGDVAIAKELMPDVLCRPEIVCMIRADEITRSPVHTAHKTEHELGYALRFPRFMGYRPDKSAKDATTVDELQRLFALQHSR